MSDKLDKYEQDIEDNYEKRLSIPNLEEKIKLFQEGAKQHLKNKKAITIRVSLTDIEAIKIKASKHGLPYQTYINMLIHKDAIKL